MSTEGKRAPDFTVPMASGDGYDDVTEFTLSDSIGDGPIVLAFVPGAFTGGCTEEMCTFGNELASFEDLGASVYGISVDLPFAQNIWMEMEDFDVPMLSDWDHEVIHAYDVVYENMYGSIEAAQRSVFVIDSDGIITYRWVRGSENPEFDTFVAAVRNQVKKASQ